MSLTEVERSILQRRLARRRGGSGVAAGLLIGTLAVIVLIPLFIAFSSVAGAAILYINLADELEQGIGSLQDIEERESFQTTRIYDRNGVLLREMFGEGRRTYVPISEIPTTLLQATIATEDKTFYENAGVDLTGIMRAAYGEVSGQPGLGGGSTITQQFVRHVAFSYEERIARSYTRKIKEIVLALILTDRHDKDSILEWYLNEIYYGNLAYGAEAAAQTVFGKPVRELDLAESALLAGLPQYPVEFNPLSPDPDVRRKVADRQREVLRLMTANGFITDAEADAAQRKTLTFADPNDDLFDAPHFVVHVQDLLEDMIGAERLAHGGLEIVTTLDLGMQRLGERVVKEQVDLLGERHDLSNAALVSMEPRSGQVLAMVGSTDYWNDSIDGRVNVTVRDRQPGSSIKPVTYVTALENGMSSAAFVWDVPMKLWTPNGEYEPKNYDGVFRGPVRMRASLANSYNIPALKFLSAITPLASNEEDAGKHGVELTIETAKRMGITGLNRDPWDYGLSLTLGGGEVTLLDLTTTYGTLANMGTFVRPNAILKITDSKGEVIYDLAADEEALTPVDAVDPRAAFIVTDMLSDNAARSPAFGSSSALHLGVPAAAKTGTTNDYKDNWTVGYTPYLVTGVWAGNNDNTPMRNSSGLTGAAPIWQAFMRNVVFEEDQRAKVQAVRESMGFEFSTSFARPPGIVERSVCLLQSLNELGSACKSSQTELFIEEYLPQNIGTDGESGTSEAADVWTTIPSVVVPVPPPSPEQVAAAAAAEEELRWPTALLCLPGAEGFGLDKAQSVAVLPLPADEEERRFVLEWATKNNWGALEPSQLCSNEMIEAALAPGSLPGSEILFDGNVGQGRRGQAEYRLGIAPDTRLDARTVLTGTAVFDPSEIEYFKVELGPGREPSEWITLGDVHRQSIVDGPMEVLDAASLAPGDYIVRLVLVKTDGNFLNPPYSVPIRVGPAPEPDPDQE